MSRITFLIGNGFDINAGLDTRYSDFYQYYFDQYPEDMLAKTIRADYDFWSDLEIGLGKYAKEITESNEDVFFDSKDVIESALADYLEEQMSRIQIEGENAEHIVREMQNSVLRFYEGFPNVRYEDIRNVIASVENRIAYSFISFNYTDTLDRCIQLVKERVSETIGKHQCRSTVYTDFLGDVLHIHGTTRDGLVLGVNDESQVDNERLCANELNRQCMIKTEANERLGENKIRDAKRLIDGSVIICVFGMSIGATDKLWWEHICEWLLGADKRRLIIFVKSRESGKRITNRQLFMNQDKILNKLKMNAGISEDEWQAIKSKVHVQFDSPNFQINVVEE